MFKNFFMRAIWDFPRATPASALGESFPSSAEKVSWLLTKETAESISLGEASVCLLLRCVFVWVNSLTHSVRSLSQRRLFSLLPACGLCLISRRLPRARNQLSLCFPNSGQVSSITQQSIFLPPQRVQRSDVSNQQSRQRKASVNKHMMLQHFWILRETHNRRWKEVPFGQYYVGFFPKIKLCMGSKDIFLLPKFNKIIQRHLYS